MTSLDAVLPLVTSTPSNDDQRSPRHEYLDVYRGGLSLKEREGEGGVREEVESDQPLAPDPSIIYMGVNSSPPLGTIVKVTHLHRYEVLHTLHPIPHPGHQGLAKWWEAIETTNLDLLSLEVHLGSIVLQVM